MKFNKGSLIVICLVLLCSISVVCAHDNCQSSNTIKYPNFTNSVDSSRTHEISLGILNVTDKVEIINCCTILVYVFDDYGTKFDQSS